MTNSRPVVGVYPGSFDPVTRGHEDVARRTLRVCDRLVVAVAIKRLARHQMCCCRFGVHGIPLIHISETEKSARVILCLIGT